jgi:hypothetical protein
MEKKEIIFAEGIKFFKAREGAPEFVKGDILLKTEDLMRFCQLHQNDKGEVRLSLLRSKPKDDGSTVLYLALNQYQKNETKDTDF